jgi:polyisoprenoid-binding protein YceI
MGLVLAAPSAAATAGTLTLHLDPAGSSASFTLDATLHTVHGELGPASGDVAFDPETAEASGEVVIDLTGADTGNGRRDTKMHEKILETDRFPSSTLRVQRINLPRPIHQGRNELQLLGELSLHGATHQVSLPAVAELDGDRVTATAWIDVPFVDWGLDDPSFFVLRVGKSVRVEIRAAGRLEGELPASALEPAAQRR